jgi:predicted porin
MKKTLVALAALAATASFAQSSVTISGNLDYAYSNTTGSALINNGTTVATTTGTGTTSVLRFIAVEDLGGGLKATAQYNFDPRTLANDAFKVTESGTSGKNTATGLSRDEVFVGLSGGFGNVRLGSPNSLGLAAHGVSSPAGTGIASGYALSQSVVTTRYDRAIAYNSPVFNGFSVAAQHAPGNDEAASSVTDTALGLVNNRKATELALNYSNGPLNVSYVNIGLAAKSNKVGYYSGVEASAKTNSNMLSANYTIGATTVYVGFINGDAIAASATPSTVKLNRVALKQNLGSIDIIVQAQELTTTTAAGVEVKSTLSGLRADYNLSKTAAVYLGYQKGDSGTAYANTATSGDNTTVSVGLRKSF